MVRFGVIGTSWITDEFIRCASLIGDFRLSAVYSRSERQARDFADKYAVKHVFTDLEAMAESNLLDAVYIASPNSLHGPQSMLFMQHQKHVLCEKPIASNVRELTEMVATAKANQVVLMEALKTTFLPSFQAIKDNLHKIGPVRRYFGSYCQYSSRYDLYKAGGSPNTFNPAFSNGSLMDIGIYCVYPAVHLFGKPTEILASALLLESGIDGEGSITLKYDHMDGVIMHSKIANSSIPSEIQGEKGNILIDRISLPEKAEIMYKNGDREDITPYQSKDFMVYETKEFIDLIQNHQLESSINSHQRSLQVMEILETARRQVGLCFPADQW